MKHKGIVFNIQKFTVHDGPGIRTEIFLKGCTLRCLWCSNPESFTLQPQVGVYSVKCIGTQACGACLKVCPKADQHPFTEIDGKITGIDREICDNCMKCQEACPADALKRWGIEMDVEQVMKIIRSDLDYYEKSGGGVTISGGESLFQWEFALDILKACKKEEIHTCVESALAIHPTVLEQIIPYCDMFITDIKHMDNAQHKRYTGMGNHQILNNIKTITASKKPVVLRLPIIPEVNDNLEHIHQVSNFIMEELDNKLVQVQLLRFRRLGEEKYASLGIPYIMDHINPERGDFEDKIQHLAAALEIRGIPAFAGTTHKINISKPKEEIR